MTKKSTKTANKPGQILKPYYLWEDIERYLQDQYGVDDQAMNEYWYLIVNRYGINCHYLRYIDWVYVWEGSEPWQEKITEAIMDDFGQGFEVYFGGEA
jgi:hypothetical protein